MPAFCSGATSFCSSIEASVASAFRVRTSFLHSSRVYYSPLTPALSPLRGEGGETNAVRRLNDTRCAYCFRLGNFILWKQPEHGGVQSRISVQPARLPAGVRGEITTDRPLHKTETRLHAVRHCRRSFRNGVQSMFPLQVDQDSVGSVLLE